MNLLTAPTSGGPLQRLLPGVAELDWSPDGERLVATVAHRRSSLWRIPLVSDGTVTTAGEPTLLLADGATPRAGPGFVLFTASRGVVARRPIDRVRRHA